MPDSGQLPKQDRHVGAGGLSSGVSPLLSGKDKLFEAYNVNCDLPGIVSRRRGIQDLSPTAHYSSLSGLSTSFLPRRVWCFDNNLFVYLEDSTHGAIAAYDLIGGAWQIVQASGSKLEMDSATRKVASKAFDRTMITLTALGPYRLSALYGTSATSQYTYSSAFRAAGVPRALDPRCQNAAVGAGGHGFVAVTGYNWLLDKTSVAYRTCWVYRDENGILLSGAPSGRIVVRNTTGSAQTTKIKVLIPSGVTARHVIQVYRTNVMPADGTGSIPDPGDDMFLAGEYQPNGTDTSNGYLIYPDISFDGVLGDELYTNNSQDGEGQARFQPPLARCIERFGNCAWYGDVTERQRLTIKILAVSQDGTAGFPGIRVDDHITAADFTMQAKALANEETQDWYFAADQTTGSGGEVIRCLKTTESFCYKFNVMSNKFNGRFYAYNLTSNDDVVGVIEFEEKSVGGSNRIFVSADRIDNPTAILPYPGIATAGTGSASCSAISTNIGATIGSYTPVAAPFVPAAGDKIFISPYGLSNASGASSNKFALTGIPSGEYTVLGFSFGVVTFDITGAGANSNVSETVDATHGGYVFQTFAKTGSLETHACSQLSRIKNRAYWSAPGEFESAPVVNFKDFGNADSKINAIASTATSIFIMKEDGVWRGRGTDGQWEFELMDAQCNIIAPNSPAVVMGDVYAYSSNGTVRISEGGVTKISTEVGTFVDGIVRAISANQTDSKWIEGVAHDEDQSYLLSVPSAAGQGGTFYVYRFHIPSKKWSVYEYPDNFNNKSSFSWSVASMCMASATRYDSNGSTEAYIHRLVVAHNSAPNSIGIERRTERFRDLCDFDVGYQAISSYNTSLGKIVLAAGCPASVSVGDVIWARNAASPNETFRAPITAISTTSVANDTITIATDGTITPLSGWPAVGTVQAVFMLGISSVAAYCHTHASEGFSTSHFSDISISVGSFGRYSDIAVAFYTDIVGSSAAGTITTTGAAHKLWTTMKNGQYRSGSVMSLAPINLLVPQDAQRCAVMLVEVSSAHAWEPLDIAALQVSMMGEAKVRRGF